ncbi:MAG: LEA type 2 family protein [Pseudobdellovibrio sp.]
MRKVILLMSLFVTTGCALLEKAVEAPEVSLSEVKVIAADMSDVKLDFILNAKNKNGIDISLNGVQYTLTVDNKTFTTEKLDQTFSVKAHSEAQIHLPLTLKTKDILSTTMSILTNKSIPYTLEGKTKLGLIAIPFKKDGTFKAKELLEKNN